MSAWWWHEREQLVGQLREQDIRKDEFLATLAHELRNPLASIRNGLQLMKLAENDGEAVERSREMMERQLGYMVRLIDDLLDLSRVLIEQMGHDLTLAVSPEPIYVDGDMTRLTQVVSNLLNNAAKYTHRGGGQEEDQRRSMAAGFDAHLVKPVDLSVLEKLLTGCLRRGLE